MDQVVEAGNGLSESLDRDPHRPQYHFLPKANWLNDPNGLIQWKGQYHLFYQHNPNGPFHGTIHWGHAQSADLVHWTHLPIALAPGPDGPDKEGVWSGCAVNHNGIPTILYTAVQPQTQCLAWSEDDLLTWHKLPHPVLQAPPAGLDLVPGGGRWDWRDPWVWREDDGWYMLLGSGIRNVGGTALLYRSPDLLHWTYLHPILIGDRHELGEIWECPNLFPLGDGHVLLISVLPEFRHTYYLTGTYTRRTFHPIRRGKIDHGAYLYAALTMRDDLGRRLLWGWIKEGRDAPSQWAAGWSGAMSLPRVLDLLPDGTLGMAVAPELTALRDQHRHWADIPLSSTGTHVPPDVRGRCLEIIATFDPGDAQKLGLWICRSADDEERTLIAYEVAQQRLIVERSESSLAPGVDRGTESAPLTLAPGEPLRLHIFLDCSIIEVFAGSRTCLTSRVYPICPNSTGVNPAVFGGRGRLISLDAWTMRGIT